MYLAKQKIAGDFSRAAPRYEREARLQREIMRRLAESAPWADGPVLDAGAGTGLLARLHPGREIISMDIAEGMCRRAGRHAVAADMEALPFAPESFGGVFCSLALQWLARPEDFFMQAHACTRSGGWLAVATLTAGTLRELRAAYRRAGLEPNLLEFQPAPRIGEAATAAGWRIRRETAEIRRTRHADVASLLRHFKALGARGAIRSIRHRGDLERLKQAYAFRNGELTASWEVRYLVAEKP